MSEQVWREAESRVQSEIDADVRAEAADVFLAEAARTRLVDHAGDARLLLRCGQKVRGRLVHTARVDGHLVLVEESGVEVVVPTRAVIRLSGSRPGLRDESARDRTLASRLRERWIANDAISVLDASGCWHIGALDFVGADHVVMRAPNELVTIPMAAVEAWRI